MTFDDYVRGVMDVVQSVGEDPILVGHSMTAIISQVAERIPSKIRALVYVAGLLLENGQTMLDVVNEFDPKYLAEILWAGDRKTAWLSPLGVKEFLYPLCPSPVVETVVPWLTAEPVAPYEARLEISAEDFGRVPRYYIECLRDRVIPLALQRKMHSALPCKRVYSIDTDHSPFFSAASELTSILSAIAETK